MMSFLFRATLCGLLLSHSFAIASPSTPETANEDDNNACSICQSVTADVKKEAEKKTLATLTQNVKQIKMTSGARGETPKEIETADELTCFPVAKDLNSALTTILSSLLNPFYISHKKNNQFYSWKEFFAAHPNEISFGQLWEDKQKGYAQSIENAEKVWDAEDKKAAEKLLKDGFTVDPETEMRITADPLDSLKVISRENVPQWLKDRENLSADATSRKYLETDL